MDQLGVFKVRYLGSKRRIAKKIINYIQAERDENMTWVEPFMGSAQVISRVPGKRIGSDIHKELIAMFKALQNGWIPPSSITEKQYNEIKNNKNAYPDHLVAFVGFGCSFGAKWFGGYAKRNNSLRNDALESRNALIKLIPKLKNLELYSCEYYDLSIPKNSIIYCDPPYINTTGYGMNFNHDEFYQWCKDKVKEGHKVFISEYEAPFKKVWSQQLSCTLDKKTQIKVECLFSVHEPNSFSLRKY